MSNEKETYELKAKLAAFESELKNIKEWNNHQNERMDKIEEKIETRTNKLSEKIDKIIENEKQLLATINDSDSVLDDKIDERFNKLQAWLLGTAASAGIGLLMFILEKLMG